MTARLREITRLEREAEEEEASRNLLKAVHRALRRAFEALPPEEYDWFDLQGTARKVRNLAADSSLFSAGNETDTEDGGEPEADTQMSQAAEAVGTTDRRAGPEPVEFYEFPGPLYRAGISPSSCIVRVRQERELHCLARDRRGRAVEDDLVYEWEIKGGEGRLSSSDTEIVTYTAPDEPGLAVIGADVVQDDTRCHAECIVTVTESLIDRQGRDAADGGKGIPGYTFLRSPGELWRSRYDEKKNLIVINNGHADYLYASRKKTRKLKYICRLFAKELVLKNFVGFDTNELLERLIELSLYTEEHLR